MAFFFWQVPRKSVKRSVGRDKWRFVAVEDTRETSICRKWEAFGKRVIDLKVVSWSFCCISDFLILFGIAPVSLSDFLESLSRTWKVSDRSLGSSCIRWRVIAREDTYKRRARRGAEVCKLHSGHFLKVSVSIYCTFCCISHIQDAFGLHAGCVRNTLLSRFRTDLKSSQAPSKFVLSRVEMREISWISSLFLKFFPYTSCPSAAHIFALPQLSLVSNYHPLQNSGGCPAPWNPETSRKLHKRVLEMWYAKNPRSFNGSAIWWVWEWTSGIGCDIDTRWRWCLGWLWGYVAVR